MNIIITPTPRTVAITIVCILAVCAYIIWTRHVYKDWKRTKYYSDPQEIWVHAHIIVGIIVAVVQGFTMIVCNQWYPWQ